MEPVSAVVAIVGSYGVDTVVRALTGSADLGNVSGELFRALAESESRIEERLSGIENRLDELLEQRYSVELGAGVRYFLEAGTGEQRALDLERARGALITASSAARSPLQRAIAERYITLICLAQQRAKQAEASLVRMESEATAAAFQAMALTELNKNFYETLPDTSPRQWQADISPPRDARAAAAETLGLCGRMLGEAAALASPLGLPPRATPPPSTPNLEWLAGGEDTASAKEMRHTRATEPLASAVAERFLPGFGKPVHTDPLAVRLRDYQKPYWQFRMKPGEVFRIGSLCLEVLTREAAGTRDVTYIARLGIRPPLTRPVVMRWLHAEYGGPRPRVPRLGQASGLAEVKPGPRLLAHRSAGTVFPEWRSGNPVRETVLRAELEEAELSFLPSAKPTTRGYSVALDTSQSAVSLNPAYIAPPFIAVAVATP